MNKYTPLHVPGVLPIDRSVLQQDPRLQEAWLELDRKLEEIYKRAQRVEDYLFRLIFGAILDETGARSYAGLHGELLYPLAARSALPYLVNIVMISGEPGTGKSTLLASYVAYHRSQFYRALLGTASEGVRYHVMLDVIDVTLVPPTDSILQWMLKSLLALIDNVRSFVAKLAFGWRPSQASESLDRLQELVEEAREKLVEEAANVLLDPQDILWITSELEEYKDAASRALDSGYSLALRYAKFTSRLRSVLRSITRGEPMLIVYALDDIDALKPDRLLEVILACKMLSLDPYSVCLVSAKGRAFIAERIRSFMSAEASLERAGGAYINTRRYANRSTSHSYIRHVDIGYVLEKFIFNAPEVRIRKPECNEIEEHMPLSFKALYGTRNTSNNTQDRLSLSSLAERIHIGTKDNYIPLRIILFDNYGYLEGCNIYGYNIRMLRCLDRVYTLLYDLASKRKSSNEFVEVNAGNVELLHRILNELATCTIDVDTAALLRLDMSALIQGIYDQRIVPLNAKNSTITSLVFVDNTGVRVEYNQGILVPLVETPATRAYGIPGYGASTNDENIRGGILAALMRDIAVQAGIPAHSSVNVWLFRLVYRGGKGEEVVLPLPLLPIESLDYLHRLTRLISRLAQDIREDVARLGGIVGGLVADFIKFKLLLAYILANLLLYHHVYVYLANKCWENKNKKCERIRDVNDKMIKAFKHTLENLRAENPDDAIFVMNTLDDILERYGIGFLSEIREKRILCNHVSRLCRSIFSEILPFARSLEDFRGRISERSIGKALMETFRAIYEFIYNLQYRSYKRLYPFQPTALKMFVYEMLDLLMRPDLPIYYSARVLLAAILAYLYTEGDCDVSRVYSGCMER